MRWRPRRSSWPRMFLAASLLALVAFSVSITLSSASLQNEVTTDDVTVRGASVRPPHGLTATVDGTDVRVAWTPPTLGLPPERYEITRRQVPGAFPDDPIGDVASSPFVDTTTVACATYEYRVTSRNVNLVSDPSQPTQVTVDVTPPTLAQSVVVRTATPQLAGIVAPGNAYYLYANLADDCSTDAQLQATMTQGSTTLPATYGPYTPLTGGATYEFRAGPFTVPTLGDGASMPWSLTVTDHNGNRSTPKGAPALVDASGPVAGSHAPMLVSATTNYFAPETGYASIVDKPPNDRFFVYGDFTDASGVASVTANVSQFTKNLTNLPLAAGSFATDNGIGWGWRSGETTSTEGRAQRSLTVTATDRLGNATTFTASAFIENQAPKVSSCTSSNGGDGALLDNGDTTTVTFNQDIDPASIAPGWTGLAPVPVAVVVRNGAKDTIEFPGVSLILRLELAGNWTAADVAFPSSTLTRISSTGFRIRYDGLTGTSTVTQMNVSGQAFLHGSITDVAAIGLRGNPTDTQQEACGTDV